MHRKLITQIFLQNLHSENFTRCRNLHLQKSVQCRFVNLWKVQNLHSENNLRCRFAHFVHDGFSHICTFVRFVHDTFLNICRIVEFTFAWWHTWKYFSAHRRTCKLFFFYVFAQILSFCQISSKSQKSRKSSKCQIRFRRFLTCSRKCPKKAHVFLSGTRVVPGPTRLTTQGGKSRQNMH